MRTTAALAGVAASAALALSGCGIFGTSVFDLEAGDCFLWPGSEAADGEAVEIGSVTTVACDEPHDAEIYHVFDVTDGAYDEDRILGEAFDVCVAQFEIFIGTEYAASEIYLDGLTPTAEGWEGGDHEVACYVYIPDESVTGSLQGAQR